MGGQKPWDGPFKFENGSDGKCVKCDDKWQYRISFCGYSVAVCREHAIEGLTSKEGRRTLAEAEREIDEIDAERWRSLNTHRLAWVPVGEKLPEGHMKRVILSDGDWVTFGRLSGDGWHVDESAEGCGPVGLNRFSHWMEMPRAPFG